VNLKFTGPVTIEVPQVIASLPLPDTTKAELTINTELYNSGIKTQKIILKGKIENIEFSKSVEVKSKEKMPVSFTPQEFKQLSLEKPRLWWPNGYGNPELYNLKLTALLDNEITDSKTVRFGVREMSYELLVNYKNQNKRIEFDPVKDIKNDKLLFDNINRVDVGGGTVIPKLKDDIDISLFKEVTDTDMGPYLVVKVNGRKIFCKGGNWGMDDGMKQVSREKLEPYFKLHREAHFNMIRNWTGESTEEVFYTLADEYGLLVWNDFWMSTEGYNVEPLDNKLFLYNVTDVIKRFRNHPSIALWCPRNEGYAPVPMEEDLAKIILKEDPTRYYQPNSRYINLKPSGPWHYFKTPADYFSNDAKGFNTEIGTPSVPTAASMQKMMAPEDVWPISDVWFYHDLHGGQKDYRDAIDTKYGASNSLVDFCKKAQMINYDSHRAMFEAWNSKLWNTTSGILLWMTHPAWPSTVWQTYSWDYETFGSYYGAQKACEPLHIQINLNDNAVSIINTSLKSFKKLLARVNYYNLKGDELYKKEITTDAPANKLTACFTPEIPASLPSVYLVRSSLQNENGEILSVNDYWKSKNENGSFPEFNQISAIKLNGRLLKNEKGTDNKIELEITNNSTVPAIAIKLNLIDQKGNIVLPAYCSEGYFNLLPGESRIIYFEYSPSALSAAGVNAEGYNVALGLLIEIK